MTGVSILRPDKKTNKKPASPARTERVRDSRDTGSALRSVYQRTVEEAIPAEMLDLLNKLD